MTNAEALRVLHRIQKNILAVTQGLDNLELEEREMAVDPTITAVIGQIDDATNAIAARIQALIDAAVAQGSVSAAEVVAALQPEVTKLQALGADPGNPVPVVP